MQGAVLVGDTDLEVSHPPKSLRNNERIHCLFGWSSEFILRMNIAI